MKRRLFALAVAAVVASAESAPAIDLPGLGWFKKRQEKKEPEKKEPTQAADKQHVSTLESDRDEGRRKAAASALRGADPKTNFDAVAALSNALLKDPSPEVRATAAESLGAFRVVYQQAVTALEKAEDDDPDKGVRAAAKSALLQYSLAGYKQATTAKSQSAEPPLAKPAAKPATVTAAKPTTPEVPFRSITQGPGTTAPFAQSSEPPLARPAAKSEPKLLPAAIPAAKPTVAPPPGVPQRMPANVPQRMPSEATPKTDPPKTDSSPLPLPTVPSLPQAKQVPTVMPPPSK